MNDHAASNTDIALVIDDDPVMIEFFHVNLAKMGFSKVIGSSSATEAKKLLEEGLMPQLIICDLNMPGEDGFDFLTYAVLHKLKMPIIVCSGSSEHLNRSLGNLLKQTSLNFITALSKPVKLILLARAVIKCKELNSRQTRKPPATSTLSIEQILQYTDVFFQPKYCGKTLTMVGAEVLARVILEDGTIVSPAMFLPKLKNSEYSHDFTLKIVEKTAQYLHRMSKKNNHLSISINVGINDIKQKGFHKRISNIFSDLQVPSERIVFEITEDEIYDNDLPALVNMGRLIIDGFTFSLDDFGTGFSNFERLKILPINELKLDKIFIDKLGEDPSAASMVAAFIAIAHSLSLKTVAEGVENSKQLEILSQLGVDQLQGYLLTKPCSFEHFCLLPHTVEL